MAAVAGIRLRIALRRFLDVDENHADAVPGTVHRHRGLSDAAHPLGHARSAERRLRAYGACQGCVAAPRGVAPCRSEEHTSELQSLMRISYAVFCLKKKTNISYLMLIIHLS